MYSKNIIFIMICFGWTLTAQKITISGTVFNNENGNTIAGALVTIPKVSFITKTDEIGNFIGKIDAFSGEFILEVSHEEYTKLRIPVSISNQNISLGDLYLQLNFSETSKVFATIDLSNDILNTDDNSDETQPLLQSKRDSFLRSVAFNWSSTFFKVRGQGSENAKVVLNGVEVNKLYSGRPNWSNWTGLNDIIRSQNFSSYLNTTTNSFGGLLGVTELQTEAFNYRKGTKVSLSSTNRSYQGRLMATYHSGELKNGFSCSISASTAQAKEGYRDGTILNNYSFFGSVSKILTQSHTLSFSSLFTPVERGKSSPNTQEVFNIKGRKYNAYWGNLQGRIRNSRVKKVKEPIFILNHLWKPNSKLELKNNLLYQTGSIRNSRLEFNGRSLEQETPGGQPIFSGNSINPDPTYYQKLPSYFLRDKNVQNFEGAFLARQQLEKNGQLNWNDIYQRNRNRTHGIFTLYEDVVEDDFVAANSIWDYKWNENLNLQGKIVYRNLKSKNYAEIIDLLGAKGFLDINSFEEGDKAQNNLQNPNNIVVTDTPFRYNYNLHINELEGFLQANYNYFKWDIFLASSFKKTSYQRNGLFENGSYPKERSLGKSKKLNFTGTSFKLLVNRQITPKLYVSANAAFQDLPPTIEQSFSNPRQNNDEVINLKNQQKIATDFNVNFRSEKLKSRLSAYHIEEKNTTDVNFFFTENIASLGRQDNSAFVQEIITGLNTSYSGLELGSEVKLSTNFTVNFAAAIGKHTHTNNPNLYLTSDSFEVPLAVGQSKLKGYRVANGPQQAFGFGFSYRDPKFWWFSTQLNHFSNSFINISPFLRTQSFATDIDGQPLLNYNEEKARELLQQEEFGSYFLWNAIGGKSWRFKRKYTLGVTLGVQNILNTVFKTGGFEQTRNSNFNTLNEDRNREFPLFGNRYWWGNGTTFYLNTYLRF